jgi:hypothetical protein
LVGLEEAAQGRALLVVQVLEHILWVHPAALAIPTTQFTPFTRTNFATRGLISARFLTPWLFPSNFLPAGLLPAGFRGTAFAPGALIWPEITPRRALAFDGAFVPRTFLRIEELGQGRKRQPAQGCAKRTEDRGRFHNGFNGSPDSVSLGIWSFNVATRQIVRCRGGKGDAAARKPLHLWQ